MGDATKPLIVLVGNIDKSFGLEELVGEVREKLEEYTGTSIGTESEAEEQQSFIDPSIIPMKVSKFCGLLDLTDEAETISKAYKKTNGHFLYPIDAMLRLVFFQRLSMIKYYTTLDSKVRDDRIAEDLGFKKNGDGFLTPAERSINRFVNERLHNGNLKRIQESFTKRLKKELAKKGIKLGRRITVDSTPLPTLRNDECGKYNAYYFQKYSIGKMVKVHFASDADTGIPLAMIVTDGTAYDGHYLVPLLERIKELGLEPEEVYGDGHYGTIDNWAMCSMLFNLECYFQIPDNAKFNKKGTEEFIEKTYNGLAFEEGLNYDVSIEEMIKVLFDNGCYEEVGNYFRNQWLKVKQETPEEYERIYHRRNVSENLHSILKEQLLFDENLNVKV